MKLYENTRMLPQGSILLVGAVIACSLFLYAGQAQGLVIDHSCTDISKVPATWIQQAKTQFRIGYGHTSHGSQLVTGIATLYSQLGSPYDYTSSSSGLVPGMFLNDYWASGDLGAGGDLTWRDATVEMLNMPGNDRNVVMWSWCGGVSDNTAGGINAYLQAMNELEQMWPGVTFIYMTGHLDGTGVSGNLNQMNELIRQFCRANNKTLFDFANIESCDPDGNEFLSRNADDGCNYSGGNWADEWSAAHPDDPLCADCDCAHSKPLNCNLKGRAFWWMMARLAGWSGSDANLPAPTGVSASDGSFSNMVQVTWNAVAGAVGYEVWRDVQASVIGLQLSVHSEQSGDQGQDAAADSRVKITDVTGTSYDDTNAVPGTIYYYEIRAVNGSDISPFSTGDAGYAGRLSSSQQIPADFDGDAKADFAIYQEATGTWHIWLSVADYMRVDVTDIGGPGLRAAAADFDGDAQADLAVFNAGDWTIWLSSIGYQPVGPITCGATGDLPVPVDFDGDRLADPAVFNNGQWTFWLSSDEYRPFGPLIYGASGDLPVPGDYDGDRLADPGVFRAGLWTVWLSSAKYLMVGPLEIGSAEDTPVPADYDGDRLTDPAVYQASGDTWTIWLSVLNYDLVGPLQLE